MAFNKITPEDRAGKGNVGQPDTPQLVTSDMQALLDSLPNLAIDKHNELVDALNSVLAATNLGAQVPAGITAQGNVQSIINSMTTNIALNTNNRHFHANKDALDTISQENLNEYSRVSTMLGNIASVAFTVMDSNTAIPTSKAVMNFVNNYDFKNLVLRVAYPVGCVFSSRGTNPGSVFGGTWEAIDTDAANVTRYIRTS